MTKRRQRQKRVVKEVVAHHLAFKPTTGEPPLQTEPEWEDGILAGPQATSKGMEDNSTDSGNESPPVAVQNTEKWRYELLTHHKAEAIRAWVSAAASYFVYAIHSLGTNKASI